MGIYIETTNPGQHHGKARWIIDNLDGKLVHLNSDSMSSQHTLTAIWESLLDFYADHLPVCVVDNGPFEAAGVAYSREEFIRFHAPDERPRIWLMVPEDQVKANTGVKVWE